MKNLKKLLWAGTAIFAMTACTSNDDIISNEPTNLFDENTKTWVNLNLSAVDFQTRVTDKAVLGIDGESEITSGLVVISNKPGEVILEKELSKDNFNGSEVNFALPGLLDNYEYGLTFIANPQDGLSLEGEMIKESTIQLANIVDDQSSFEFMMVNAKRSAADARYTLKMNDKNSATNPAKPHFNGSLTEEIKVDRLESALTVVEDKKLEVTFDLPKEVDHLVVSNFLPMNIRTNVYVQPRYSKDGKHIVTPELDKTNRGDLVVNKVEEIYKNASSYAFTKPEVFVPIVENNTAIIKEGLKKTGKKGYTTGAIIEVTACDKAGAPVAFKNDNVEYPEGKMYYSYFLVDGQKDIYTVIRNKGYQLEVDKIADFGANTPGGDLDEDNTGEIDPEDLIDSEKLYVSVKVTPLDWLFEANKITLK